MPIIYTYVYLQLAREKNSSYSVWSQYKIRSNMIACMHIPYTGYELYAGIIYTHLITQAACINM